MKTCEPDAIKPNCHFSAGAGGWRLNSLVPLPPNGNQEPGFAAGQRPSTQSRTRSSSTREGFGIPRNTGRFCNSDRAFTSQ